MSRSSNSRRGSTNKHGKRHKQCNERGCNYCARNFTIAAERQKKAKDHE